MRELILKKENIEVIVRYSEFDFSIQFKNTDKTIYYATTIEEFFYDTNMFNGFITDVLNDLEEDNFIIENYRKLNVA